MRNPPLETPGFVSTPEDAFLAVACIVALAIAMTVLDHYLKKNRKD